jgi:hypothetical protein
MLRRGAERALRMAHHVVRTRLIPRLAWPLGFARTNRQTIAAWPASDGAVGPRVAIFCHFDQSGGLRDHVLHYLKSLGAAGLSVVFVTNSGRLQPAALERLKLLCAVVLIRRNIGYDFGAWRDAIDQLGLPRSNTEMLLLLNDSVYGPLHGIEDALARVDFSRADFWGLTESWQTRYHLQSFFLAVAPCVMVSPAWRQFWLSVRPVPSKHWVIEHYEIGFSQMLLRAGFRCRAVWPYAELVSHVDPSLLIKRRGKDGPISTDPLLDLRREHAHRIRRAAAARIPLNPTSDLWRQLLRAGFPFVKRELLRDNPTRVLDVADWRSVLEQELKADPSLIELDLQRVLRNQAP